MIKTRIKRRITKLIEKMKVCYRFIFNQGKLPDFIIIGVQKSGTGALVENLRKHPMVSISIDDSQYKNKKIRTREMHFFDAKWKKGVEWYKRRFSGPCAGEKTPEIMLRPLYISRMATTVPNAKLIVVLRNPVDRAYSNYMMFNQSELFNFKDKINMTFEKYITIGMNFLRDKKIKDNSDEKKASTSIDKGLYYQQLVNVLKYYPREQIHIVIAEQMRKDTNKEINKIYKFFGLSSYDLSKNKLYNTSSKYQPMDSMIRKKLVEFYKPYNEKLYKLLGYRIEEWDK